MKWKCIGQPFCNQVSIQLSYRLIVKRNGDEDDDDDVDDGDDEEDDEDEESDNNQLTCWMVKSNVFGWLKFLSQQISEQYSPVWQSRKTFWT